MALTVNEGKGHGMAKVTVDRRLWLAEDRETLVEDGDPRATFLWAACAGREVHADEAERVGYAPQGQDDPEPDRREPEPVPEPEVEPEPEPEPEPVDDKVCGVCGYEAKTKAGLAAHARRHDSEDD